MTRETTLLSEVIWFAIFASIESFGLVSVYKKRKMIDIIGVIVIAVVMTIQFFAIHKMIYLGAY